MKLLRQLGTMTVARGFEALVQALLLILLARELGPVLFGVVAVYHSVHSVAFIVCGMNTATFVVREEALGRRDLAYGALRTNAIVVSCALGLVLSGTLLVYDQPLVAVAVAANAVGAWSQQLSDNRLAIRLAHRVVWGAFTTTVARSTSSLVVFVALVLASADAALAFSAARLAAAAISLILASVLARLDSPGAPARTRTVLKLQLPLAVAPAASSLRNLDATIVAAIAGLAAGGLYGAATRIVTPVGMIAPALNPVLIPRLATASPRRAIRVLDALFCALLVATVVPVFLWSSAEDLVVLIFGPAYEGGGEVLVWVLLRLGPLLVGGLIAGVLQAQQLDGKVALNSTLVAVGTLLGALLGALVAGASGAAVAVAAVSLVGSLRLWFAGRRGLKRRGRGEQR